MGRALQTTPFESVLAGLMVCLAMAVTAKNWHAFQAGEHVVVSQWLLACWLLYYALIFGAAPIYAFKSYTGAATQPVPIALSKRIRSVA